MIPTSMVKAKPFEHLAAEEVQRQHRQEGRAGGDDGPRQRLVDGGVDHLLERVAAHLRPQVLAHPVEDDDGVVHRVAGDGQQRGDDVQRQVVAEEGQEGQRDQHVVERGDDGADGEGRPEAEGDVDGDAGNRGQRGVDALQLQVAADHRPDDLLRQQLELRQAGLLQRLDDGAGAQLEAGPLLGCRAPAAGPAPGCRPGRRRSGPPSRRGPRRARCAPRPRTTGGSNLTHDDGAAGEVDAERDAAARDIMNATPARTTSGRQRQRVPAPADEVVVGVLEDAHDGAV